MPEYSSNYVIILHVPSVFILHPLFISHKPTVSGEYPL
jgi:hypothetical protein